MSSLEEDIKRIQQEDAQRLRTPRTLNLQGLSLDESISRLKETGLWDEPFDYTRRSENTGIGNYPTKLLGSLGIGAADFSGQALLSLPAWVLGNVGRRVDPIQNNIENRTHEMFKKILPSQGVPEDEISEIFSDSEDTGSGDGILTGLSKRLATGSNWWKGEMDEAHNILVGDTPDVVLRASRGTGTMLGYMLSSLLFGYGVGALSHVSPLMANFIGGALGGTMEAGVEAGTTMSDLYAQDKSRWDDAIKTANYSFMANAPTDAVIEGFSNTVNALTGKLPGATTIPGRFVRGLVAEEANEIPQEIKQEIVGNAAKKTFESGEVSLRNFLSNLYDESKNTWQYTKEIAPEVALSTAMGQGLLGALGLSTRAGRREIVDQVLRERMKGVQGANDSIMEILAPNPDDRDMNLNRQRMDYDSLKRKRDNLQNRINGMYSSFGQELDTDVETSRSVQDMERQLADLNSVMSHFWGDTGVVTNPVQDDDMDLFPDRDELNAEPTASTSTPTTPVQPVPHLLRDLQPDEQQITIPDEDPMSPTSGSGQTESTYSPTELPSLNDLGTQDNTEDTFEDVYDEPDDELDNSASADDISDTVKSLNDLINKHKRDYESGRESYNQSSVDGVDSSGGEEYVGNFNFRARSKTYGFDVIAKESQESDRLTRWNGGRVIQIRNKRGKVLAEYYPNSVHGRRLDFSSDMQAKHSKRWLQKFTANFMEQVNDYLNAAGWLDNNGDIRPDGNEGFRSRWQERMSREGYEGHNAFYDEAPQPEDFDAQRVGRMSVQSEQDGATQELSVTSEEFSDRHPEIKRLSGRYLDFRDEHGVLVARYSPYLDKLEIVKGHEGLRGQIREQLKNNLNTYLSNGGFLDESGNLRSDGNEGYRDEYRARKVKGKKQGIIDGINAALNLESYNQSGAEESDSISTGEPTHRYKVEVGEFSDKYPEQKQYFGRYLNIKDETDRTVARYSPYTKKLQMADGYEGLQGEIAGHLKKHHRKYLEKAGFLDERGKLKSDSNEEYRHQYRTRADTTPEGREVHPNNQRGSEGKREDKRSLWEKSKDNYSEWKAKKKVRKSIEKNLRRQIQKLFVRWAKNEETTLKGELKETVKENIERMTKAYSAVLTTRLANAAHLAGMRIEDYYKLWNVRFQFENTIPDDKVGTKAWINPNEVEFDEDGSIKSVSTVIHLTEFANESTVLHELAHAYLRDYQDLMATVHDLPKSVTQDWINLTKWLGISDIDLTKTVYEMTPDERERYHNAQEKFAVSFEQYYMKGEAPTMWLKRAFKNFKNWLMRVYGALRNVKYVGQDGESHDIELSPEIQGIFDRVIKSRVPFVPNAENEAALRARIEDAREKAKERERANQRAEEHYQTRNDNQSVRENIARGTEAMNRVITEQTDVMNAMYRNDLGSISFLWGEAGRDKKLKHGWGISHLIARRNQQGYNGEDIARKMVDVIAQGNITRKYGQNVPNGERVDISHDGHTAVLSLYKDGNKLTWLLSGWKDYDKSSGATGEGYGSTSAMLNEPMRTRPTEGAENSAQSVAGDNQFVNGKGTVIKERAMTEGITSGNDLTPEVQFPNAQSSGERIDGISESVKRAVRESYEQADTSRTIRRTNDTLISPDEIERYNQVHFHATGHIIKDNKFGLEFISSGEGSQAYGYGIYFAQARDVAETYRKHGIPNEYEYSRDLQDRMMTFTFSNGERFSIDYSLLYDENGKPDKEKNWGKLDYKVALRRELINSLVAGEDIKRALFSAYQAVRSQAEDAVKNWDDKKEAQEFLDYARNHIPVNVSGVDERQKGNIYRVDIPENDTLLDWDARIKEQPEKVQKAIKKVLTQLSKWGINPYMNHTLMPPETGEDFYHDLTHALKGFVAQERLRSKKHGLITRPDMAASLMLNQAGIPGLRYFDGQSRQKQNGTHNFVIWNTDMIRLLGLTDDSDRDAMEYFSDTIVNQHSVPESYNQSDKRIERDISHFFSGGKAKSFITPDILEQYDQIDLWHGTGHIIEGNKFNIMKIGSGEGAQVYGYGIYLAEVKKVAEQYRDYGLDKLIVDGRVIYDKGFDFTLPDGKRIVYNGWWSYFAGAKDYISEKNTPEGRFWKYLPEALRRTRLSKLDKLNERLPSVIQSYINSQLEEIKKREGYIAEMGNPDNNTYKSYFTQIQQQKIEQAQADIDYARSLQDKLKITTVLKPKHGNIYKVTGPDSNVLLDWDAKLEDQPEKIRKAMEKIKRKLESWGADTSQLFDVHNSDFDFYEAERDAFRKATGEDFYKNLTAIFNDFINKGKKVTSKKFGNVTRGDMGASFMLNQYSIPGLRYLDGLSRSKGKGTHNYVIWNVDTLKIMGLDTSSDKDAKDYFKTHKNTSDTESYNQIIGIGAAKRLDELEGQPFRTKNLKLARELERNGSPVKTIWLATGWQRGTDNRWRYEIPYGKLDLEKAQQLSGNQQSITLQEVFDAPELYKAYPELQNLKFVPEELANTVNGYLETINGKPYAIHLNSKLNNADAQSVVVHETQHAIQYIEDFAVGGNPSQFKLNETGTVNKGKTNIAQYLSKSALRHAVATYRTLTPDLRKKFKNLLAQHEHLSWREFDKLLNAELNTNERKIFYSFMKDVTQGRRKANPKVRQWVSPYDAYQMLSGEVEARNAEYRNSLDKDKKLSTPLSSTEDVYRADQILQFKRKRYGAPTSSNESYNQTSKNKLALRSAVLDALTSPNFTTDRQIISQSEQVRRQYQNTNQWLKAPNGKKTNLTEKQWLAVRTPNFKRWFGDWENDPDNSSKVLDANGEPLVVTHLARGGGGFSVFNTNGDFSPDYDGKTSGTGAWFGDLKGHEDIAAETGGYDISTEGEGIYHVFLNLRNPFIYDGQGKRWQRMGNVWIENTQNGSKIEWDDYNNRPFSNLRQAQGYINHKFHGNPNYVVRHETEFQTSDELVRAVREGRVGEGNHDGVIINNLRDMSVWGVDDYIAFEPNQIKSAVKNSGVFCNANPDIYFQRKNSDKFIAINSDGKQQKVNIPEQQLEKVRRQYEDTSMWLKAPNGQKSHLSEKQWLQVRTPAFKRWFGDWENHPKHASKVIDENGEPLVVFHGTPNGGFSIFNVSGNLGQTRNTGAFFSSTVKGALFYARSLDEKNIYPVFLNIRNPYIFDAQGKYWSALGKIWITDNYTKRNINTKQDGSPFLSFYDADDYINNVLQQNGDDDLRYDIRHDEKLNTTDQIIRAVWNGFIGNGNHDGVIFRNVCDPYTPIDEFVTRIPVNIKSATKNNGSFSTTNNEIYKQSAHNLPISHFFFDNENDTEYSTANGTPSLLRKYSNILNNSNPDNINPDNLITGNDGFISDDTLERYNQPSLHATGHIVKDNKLRLSKIGSGEGGAMFGYGLYSAQARGTVETYRKYGIPNFGKGTIHVHTTDGITFSASDKNSWDNSPSVPMRQALNELLSNAIKNNDTTSDEIISTLKSTLSKKIDKLNELIDYRLKEKKPNKTLIEQHQKELQSLQHEFQALETILGFEFSPDENTGKKGNIYNTDVPENNFLLFWDAFLEEQSELVKKGIKNIEQFIRNMANEYELDIDDLDNAQTGEDLYWGIYNIMEQYLDNNTPEDGITQPDMRTSLLLNRFGIPGHRYFDQFSRDAAKAKYAEYNAQHPEFDGGKASFTVTTKDGKTYTTTTIDALKPSWSNNPNDILKEVLSYINSYARHRREASFQEIIKSVQDRIERDLVAWKKNFSDEKDKIDEIKAQIKAIETISNFSYSPRYNAASLFADEATYNFVVWNEDAIKILGIDQDSDQDAIDYFNKYKAEHHDGFISKDFLEHYEQLKGHSSGNIIFNNRFDLRYKGTGEGGAMFGHGAYFWENPKTGEQYRRYGLKNGGLGDIHVHTSNGTVFNSSNYHNWGNDIRQEYIDTLYDIEDAVRDYRWGKKNIKLENMPKTILKNLAKGYRTDLRLLQPKITQGLKALRELQQGSNEYYELEDNINEVRTLVQSLKDKLDFIKSIDNITVDPDKHGNVYTFDIPEDEDLLDWDKTLVRQSKKITPIINKALDIINNNPEQLVAFRFAQLASNPDEAEKLLTDIMSFMKDHRRAKFDNVNIHLFKLKLQTLKDLMPTDNVDNIMRDLQDEYNLHVRKFPHLLPSHSSTGSVLYWTLEDILGSDELASLWLLKQGIPGHRFWDGLSRDERQGTHNYVIWDMDKISMVGISDDSDTDAKEYFYKTKAEQEKQNNNFVTPEMIEQYEQLAYHGTAHIIRDNKFNLKFVGSGQGAQSFGYGIYFAQIKDVAEEYRLEGGGKQIFITTAEGNNLSVDDFYDYMAQKLKSLGIDDVKAIDAISQAFIDRIEYRAKGYYFSINEAINDGISNVISTIRSGNEYGNNFGGKSYTEQIRKFAELYAPKDAKTVDVLNGNVYSVDVPEDFELLNWDTNMLEQSEQVLRKLKEADLFEDNYETGEELYKRLAHKDYEYASKTLNDAGIPGLFYWDGRSRDNKQGTHNFVIWNTDTLHILGISEDSDDDAQDYFRAEDYYNASLDALDNNSDFVDQSSREDNFRLDTLYNGLMDEKDNRPDNESYDQIIGIAGARKLDRTEGNSYRMDNLNIARQMEHQGKPAKKLWIATGWMRGKDGKWRFEIPDGKIIVDKFKNARKNNLELDALDERFFGNNTDYELSNKEEYLYDALTDKSIIHLADIFDAPTLYKAYPDLQDILILFGRINGAYAQFLPGLDAIELDYNTTSPKELRLSLIHEIQHAIQEREGFSTGANFDVNNDAKYNRALRQVKRAIQIFDATTRNKVINALQAKYLDHDTQDAEDIITSMSDIELNAFDIADKSFAIVAERIDTLQDKYERKAGEVEARNTETRAYWGDKRRKSTPLNMSEDILRARQIVGRLKPKMRDNNVYSRNSFVSPQNIEHYDQLVYHGTNNIIRNNRFDLRYIGSSEGSSLIAYGAYFAENPDVSQNYRHFGDPNHGLAGVTVTMKNGNRFSSSFSSWNGNPDTITRIVLNDLARIVRQSGNSDLKSIRKELAQNYRQELKRNNEPKEYFDYVRKQIKALGNISAIDVSAPRNGNLYSFDIDDNELQYLLDWDKSMSRQNEFVRGVKKEIIQEFKYYGLNTDALKKAKTGEEFYRAIQYVMRDAGRDFRYPEKGITDPQQRASLILNMHGISGVQYWDDFSRDKKRGTHNYVIWNTDTIKMLGISDDSNKDAIDYYNRTNQKQKQDNTESYNQIIGIKGAQSLDQNEGTTRRMDNLKIAQEMTQQGKDAKAIRFATGWELGHEGKWKYEIPDAIIRPDEKFRHIKYQTIRLDDILQSDELFNAYPQLRNIEVRFTDFDGFGASYEYDGNIINLDSSMKDDNDELRHSILHEVQHAIQRIEGFAFGGNTYSLSRYENNYGYVQSGKLIWQHWDKKAKSIWHSLTPSRQGYWSYVMKEINKDKGYNFDEIVDELFTDETERKNFRDWVDAKINAREGRRFGDPNISRYQAYFSLAGEVEARNVANRLGMSDDERKNTTLASTEDVTPHENQIIRTIDDKGREVFFQKNNNASEDYDITAFINSDGRQIPIPFNPPELEKVYKHYEGTDKLYKAPNGKPSNLKPNMWLLVRTPAFKHWFGDWENSPATASQVIDENSEPLVVYHGTVIGGFSTFDTKGQGSTRNTGAWFSSSKDVAMGYGPNRYSGASLYPVFLNIRRPFSIDAKGKAWDSVGNIYIVNKSSGEHIYSNNEGNPFSRKIEAERFIRTYLSDPDLKQWRVEADKFMTTNEIVRAVRNGNLGLGKGFHDGVIIRNVRDSANSENIPADDFIIFKPIQVKSATKNRGSFSTTNNEIYNQSANITQQINSDNFKRWFKDSKVVDDNGLPLVVWHGSNSDFSIFDISKARTNMDIQGFFFTPDKRESQDYGNNVRSFFLSIQNPADYNTAYSIFEKFKGQNDAGSLARNELINLGFDGVIGDGEFIAFYPEQIKSATGNNGDFDTNNPDVYYQFIGEKGANNLDNSEGNTSRLDKLKLAKDMKDKGYNSRTIWQKTGWWKAPDGKWRTEITDGSLKKIPHSNSKTVLNDIYSNDTLFKAYPQLAHLPIIFTDNIENNAISYYYGGSNPRIEIKHSLLPMNMLSALVHELQHAIQDIEGFSFGADTTHPDYLRTGGEVEARNVQARLPLNPYARANVDPDFSQDTNRWIVNGHDISIDEKTRQHRLFDDYGDIYYQRNPYVHRYETFNNPDTEAEYSRHTNDASQDGAFERINHALHDFLHGLKGDFPELAGNRNLLTARELLRRMNRQTDAKAQQAVQTLHNSLKELDDRQFNIFSRLMLINDIYTFKRYNPNSQLPLGFTPQSLKTERERFLALAQKDSYIMNAIQAEHGSHSSIQKELATLADSLNMKKFAEKVRRYDFYVLDYARLLGSGDFNANYIQAVAETRNDYLQDIERLNTLLEIKKKYDIKDSLIKKFGDKWQNNIPDGYAVFNPLMGRFIHSAHSLTENILDMAIEQASEHMNLSEKTINDFRKKLSDNSSNHLLVLPEAIVRTLNGLGRPIHRTPLGKIAKTITTGWKKYILYFPTRAFKYNIRNMTGDLDAVIAGNPHALTYMGQAISELYELYYGDSDNISNELREFQKRGGAITIQSTQELGDYKQLKQFQNLMNDMNDKSASEWKKLPRMAWELIDKFAWSGILNFSDFREQWLRYACYLDYLHQIQENDGIPNNWGASVKDEVMSIDDFRDRAFKMSNELLGAYDQVSDTGKQLRDVLIPFYSWMEVNAKRYYQLIKNGITEDNAGDFASRFLKGQLANVPYYAFKLGKTYLMINFMAILISAFNHLIWPDDEDKLPPDIQGRPHITLGHDTKGNVLYFDRVGAILDNLEWFAQDNSPFAPFAHDVKDIFNGQQTFSGFLSKIAAAPVNKIVNSVNPFVKMPFELLTSKSLYPEATNPSNIRDKAKYIAQSLGLNWPYKIITGQPRSDWQEFKNIFLYSADAEQAAYFYSLGKVREFQDIVLHKRFDGFAYTQRSEALRNLKTALRLDDKQAVQRYLQDYYSLGGSRQGLKTSMRNMNPLHGLSKKEQAQFLKWISPEDRIYLDRADKYFRKLADTFLR